MKTSCVLLGAFLGLWSTDAIGVSRLSALMRRGRSTVLEMAAVEVTMPALSSTMTEGKIVEWLKQPGEKIEVGDILMVVESDKADMDVEG